MPTFLVETYLSRAAADERIGHERRARSAARALTRAGTHVSFRGSTHVPEDETCYFTVEAPSPSVAALLAQRAGLEPLRVVEAVSSEKELT